jgi:hypothetical protein
VAALHLDARVVDAARLQRSQQQLRADDLAGVARVCVCVCVCVLEACVCVCMVR